MITGAILLFVGIMIGYSLPFWKYPYSPKQSRTSKITQKIFSAQDWLNKKATIVEPDIIESLSEELK